MKNADKLILIVDDFDAMRNLYHQFLPQEGFQLAFARDGQEALDRAAALKPDVILMDLSLPVMDGWEATRRLKADEKTRQIPVVMLSVHGLDGARDTVAKAGFDGALAKPCMPADLIAEITRVLNLRQPG